MQRQWKRRIAVLLVAGLLAGMFPGKGGAPLAAETADTGTEEEAEPLDSEGKDAQGVLYTLNETKHTAMVGKVLDPVDENTSQYAGAGEGKLVIPGSVSKGGVTYTVTEVAYGAFFENRDLVSVTLPDSVTVLGEKSFYHSSVKVLSLGAGLQTISAYALGQMDCLQEVTVSVRNKSFTSSEGILYNKNRTTLVKYPVADGNEEVLVPDGVYTIGESAFSLSPQKSVAFADSVRIIEEEAFYGASIETADIKRVMQIGDRAFASCTSLRWARMRDYVRLGKDIFSGDSAMRVMYIPEGTHCMKAMTGVTGVECVIIGDNAEGDFSSNGRNFFEKCPNLTTVVLGEGITYLPFYCFYKCPKLGKVYVPASVKMDSSRNGFDGSSATIYGFSNSKSWCSQSGLSFVDVTKHTHTLTDHIFYSDGEICIQGKYCKECGHAEDLSFLLQSEDEEPKEEVLTYSLDSSNQDAQGIQYRLNSDRTAYVGKSENNLGGDNYSNFEGTDAVIPERVVKDGVTYIVTTLYTKCFYNNKWMKTLTLPDTLQMLGDPSDPSDTFAFTWVLEYCDSLTGIQVGEGNPWLASRDGVLYTRDGTSLVKYPAARSGKRYEIPANVRTIREAAFERAASLYEVTFPSSLETIKGDAFTDAANIKFLDLRHVSYIGFEAFQGVENVKALILKPGATVGSYAFRDLDDLIAVVIPTNVSLGSNAFYECDNLETVVMMEESRFSDTACFINCYKLKNIILPETITDIPGKTFFCDICRRIYLPDSVQTISDEYMLNYMYVYGKPSDCTGSLSHFVDISGHTHDLQHTVFLENEYVKIEADFCNTCGYAENCVQTVYLEDAAESEAAVPTISPRPEVTTVPTISPTPEVTDVPMGSPSISPFVSPSVSPVETSAATASPTPEATAVPTISATPKVTDVPMGSPSISPSVGPSVSPGETSAATASPTPEVTTVPMGSPSISPSASPSASPAGESAGGLPIEQVVPSVLTDFLDVTASSSPTVTGEYAQNLGISGFRVYTKNNVSVRLTWKANQAASFYRVYRATKKNGKYKAVKTLPGSKSYYVDKKVKAAKKYYYKVTALGSAGGILTEGVASRICSISVSGLRTPKISVKKGKLGTIRYVTVRLKKYTGKYADIYIALGGGRFKKLKLVSYRITHYKGKFKIRCDVRNTSIRFKVRTYNKVGKEKRYSYFSGVKKVRA